MPSRIIALGVAALATAGGGITAVVLAAAPAAANAGCTTALVAATNRNIADGGPSVSFPGTEIVIDRGTPLAMTGAELDSAEAMVSCVVVDPANVL